MISRLWQAPGIEYDNTYFVFILGWSIISIRLMIQQSESSTCVSIFIHRCLVSNSEPRMGSFNHPPNPPQPQHCLSCTWTSWRLKRFNPGTPSASFLFFICLFFPCSLSPSFSDAGIKTELSADGKAGPPNEKSEYIEPLYCFFL